MVKLQTQGEESQKNMLSFGIATAHRALRLRRCAQRSSEHNAQLETTFEKGEVRVNESNKAYKVKVGQVVERGKHQVPYVVAWPTHDVTKAKLGSITFELTPDVWAGKSPPKNGEFIVVEDIREKPAGWNAHCARYFRPADTSNTNIVQ